jgi:hypothetical protein
MAAGKVIGGRRIAVLIIMLTAVAVAALAVPGGSCRPVAAAGGAGGEAERCVHRCARDIYDGVRGGGGVRQRGGDDNQERGVAAGWWWRRRRRRRRGHGVRQRVRERVRWLHRRLLGDDLDRSSAAAVSIILLWPLPCRVTCSSCLRTRGPAIFWWCL